MQSDKTDKQYVAMMCTSQNNKNKTALYHKFQAPVSKLNTTEAPYFRILCSALPFKIPQSFIKID